jgi:hypothetical protein
MAPLAWKNGYGWSFTEGMEWKDGYKLNGRNEMEKEEGMDEEGMEGGRREGGEWTGKDGRMDGMDRVMTPTTA